MGETKEREKVPNISQWYLDQSSTCTWHCSSSSSSSSNRCINRTYYWQTLPETWAFDVISSKRVKRWQGSCHFSFTQQYVRYLKHLVTPSLASLDCLFALHFLPSLVFRWPTTAATGQCQTIQSLVTDWLTACWNVLSPSSLPATNCTLIGVGGGLLIEQREESRNVQTSSRYGSTRPIHSIIT